MCLFKHKFGVECLMLKIVQILNILQDKCQVSADLFAGTVEKLAPTPSIHLGGKNKDILTQ